MPVIECKTAALRFGTLPFFEARVGLAQAMCRLVAGSYEPSFYGRWVVFVGLMGSFEAMIDEEFEMLNENILA